LLFQLIDKVDGQVDLLLLPAGFYQTRRAPSSLYEELKTTIGKRLEELNSDLRICLGIDGNRGLDQMALLFTRSGLEGIGRKFYPTDIEKIDEAESFLSLEQGYERVFHLKHKKFYMAVCYDSFGLKKMNLKNPKVDVILDLVHQFRPKGKGNSGDVFFARHGFAGASKH